MLSDDERAAAADLCVQLMARYKGATIDMLRRVLLPAQIPIHDIERTVTKQGTGYTAPFHVNEGKANPHLFRGRSGKVVPAEFVEGDAGWEELLKVRFHEIGDQQSMGELHYVGTAPEFNSRLARVDAGDYVEIDRFGATAKIESALTEVAFMDAVTAAGFTPTRMPEDVARHLGEYFDFDFLVEKDGVVKRIELKSLWGTDSSKARLIHSTGPRYPTSSCRFETQDFFAVNLWLRTGRITDIAYARSVPVDAEHLYGLPPTKKYPEHINQNPSCEIGDGTWFASLDEIWNLP